jgi:uncharacterized membrane protein
MTTVAIPAEERSALPDHAQRWPQATQLLAAAILIFGAILRISRWAHWRALWLDEIYLAQSIVTRGYHDLLFKPLEDWQLAPPGYLIAVRFCAGVFGAGERSLRLTSLLLSLISLPLFFCVAKRVLGQRGGIFAIALLTVLGPLIYYGDELKQYSGDVAASLAIVLVMLRLVERPTRRRAIVAAAVGAISLLFSHPAVLVLAGTGIVAAWQLLRPRRSNLVPSTKEVAPRDGLSAFQCLLLIGGAWLLAFTVIYLVFLRPVMAGESHPHLVQYWADRDAFMPLSPRWAVPWLFNRFWSICQEPGAMWIKKPDAAMIAMILGFIAAIAPRSRRLSPNDITAIPRQPILGRSIILVLAPVPIALLASGFKQYPFADRLTLFAVPLLILAMGAGIDFLWRRGPAKIAAIIIAAIVLYPSACRAVGYLTDPPGREESVPAYRWIASHWRPGDTLYLSHYAEKSYEYYRPASGWPADPQQSGRVQIQPPFSYGTRAILDDIQKLAGHGRVWVVFIHIDDAEEWLAKAALDQIGEDDPTMDDFEYGATVYLYNCAGNPK